MRLPLVLAAASLASALDLGAQAAAVHVVSVTPSGSMVALDAGRAEGATTGMEGGVFRWVDSVRKPVGTLKITDLVGDHEALAQVRTYVGYAVLSGDLVDLPDLLPVERPAPSAAGPSRPSAARDGEASIDAVLQLVRAGNLDGALDLVDRLVASGDPDGSGAVAQGALQLAKKWPPLDVARQLAAAAPTDPIWKAKRDELEAMARFPRDGERTCWACGAGLSRTALHCTRCLAFQPAVSKTWSADDARSTRYEWADGRMVSLHSRIGECDRLGAQGRERPGARRPEHAIDATFTYAQSRLQSVEVIERDGRSSEKRTHLEVRVPGAAWDPLGVLTDDGAPAAGSLVVPADLLPIVPCSGLTTATPEQGEDGTLNGLSLADGTKVTLRFANQRLEELDAPSMIWRLEYDKEQPKETVEFLGGPKPVRHAVAFSHGNGWFDRIELEVPEIGNVQASFEPR